MMNTVYVIHESQIGNKKYAFLNNIKSIKIDDKVVVDTACGLQVATVVDITQTIDTKATKLVVGKINMSAFEKKKAVFEEKQKIFKQMTTLFNKYSQTELFELIAKENKQMCDLLKQYEKFK